MDKIRQLLKQTYYPFFGRFGHLTDVQIKVIPEILQRKNVVVISEAASGKTEAVVAPLASNLLKDRLKDHYESSVLYVTPTKALVNDVYRRIFEPLGECRLGCIVRTGDKKEFSKKIGPDFIITTIESLDSMIARTKEVLKNIKYIVLDELHLVDGTYRGDQLRCLVKRIRDGGIDNIRKLQGIIISATLSNPVETGNRYFPVDSIINVSKPREIVSYFFPEISECMAFAKKNNLKKLIAFANSRKMVEKAKEIISVYWPKERVFVHHGSLSKTERLSVEHAMQEWDFCICIATTTLEIGVDIGSVDGVILLEVPPSPSSFIQRIGRGVREGGSLVALCIAKTEDETLIYEKYVELGRRGMETSCLDGKISYSSDLSVCVQQIFSMVFAKPYGVSAGEVENVLTLLTDYANIEKIIDTLIEKGFIKKERKKLYGTSKLMEMGNRGIIHSNIKDSVEYSVKDAITGKLLGEIFISANVGESFVLAGKLVEVVEIKKGTLIVKGTDIKSFSQSLNIFSKHTAQGAFYKCLPEELKN